MDTMQQARENSGEALKGITRFASGTVGALANALLIFFLALYLALEPRLYIEGALRLVPLSSRDNARQALHAAGQALHKWLLGQGIAMLGVGIATGIGLAIVDVPLALALGIVAGVAEFVPIIGPIVAAIPGVLIGFSVSPETTLYAALVYLAVQQLEGNLITPLAQRWAVALPPAIGLLSVVAFGVLFGVMGVLFATPLAVVTMVLLRELYVKDVLESPQGKRAATRP
jgi:predicted PurR-regulated permease PerM